VRTVPSPRGRTLAAKLDVVAELANEVTLQTRGVFSGYLVLSRTPCGGRMFARQELGANAKRNQVAAKSSLAGIAAVDPLVKADDFQFG